MARNVERDLAEAERRKALLLDAGLRLFAEKGIDNVKLQDVAEEAGVVVSTLYNYYQNKVNLVAAISGSIWGWLWEYTLKKYDIVYIDNMDFFEGVEFYFDSIIRLYKNHPEILRFSGQYKTYIRREGVDDEVLASHLTVLLPMQRMILKKIRNAKAAGQLNKDIPDKTLYSMIVITVLSMAERYSLGLVYADEKSGDHVTELECLKEMFIAWLKEKN